MFAFPRGQGDDGWRTTISQRTTAEVSSGDKLTTTGQMYVHMYVFVRAGVCADRDYDSADVAMGACKSEMLPCRLCVCASANECARVCVCVCVCVSK